MADATFAAPITLPANPTASMHAATKQYVDAATSGGMLVPLPAGSVTTYAGSTPPNGWLLCNGQAVGRTAYAALYAAIGTTYGAGDGSTTFNVPDLRGRVAAGLDNMGGTDAGRLDWANTLGTASGAQYHTLSTTELAAHNHGSTADGGDHSHTAYISIKQLVQTSDTGSGVEGFIPSSAWNLQLTGSTSSNGTHNHGTNNAGGGAAHNNMQPTMLLNYIISTGAGIAAPTSATVTVSGTAPASPANGDLWVDTGTPTWIAPTLLNSWANYGLEWATAGYYRDASGLVYLRGLVKSGTNNAAIFMLPSGYRPTAGRIFSVHAGGGQARLDVLYDGTVKTNGYYSSGTNAYVSLSGVFFETF